MEKMKILDLNAWLLPWPFSKNNMKRLNLIIKTIRELKPDIVALQEVWPKKYISYLKNNLEDFHVISGGTKAKLFNKGGLVILSKFNLTDEKRFTFRENKKFNLIEKIADKGSLQASFICNGHRIFLINFQFYNPVKENEKKEMISNQFKRLKSFLEKPDIQNHELVIFSGDLNLSSEEFREINNNYFLYSHNNTHTFSESNKYTRSRLNPWLCNKYMRNDYILIWPNIKGVKVISKIIKKPLLSDHYAVLSEVIF